MSIGLTAGGSHQVGRFVWISTLSGTTTTSLKMDIVLLSPCETNEERVMVWFLTLLRKIQSTWSLSQNSKHRRDPEDTNRLSSPSSAVLWHLNTVQCEAFSFPMKLLMLSKSYWVSAQRTFFLHLFSFPSPPPALLFLLFLFFLLCLSLLFLFFLFFLL